MAYQPMFSTGGGFNPMSLYESEEERQRRLREEAIARGEMPAGPVAPVAEPGPVKQTVTFDPRTGEQRMKIEGSVQDLSAANPMTPTVSMPGQTMSVAGPMAPAGADTGPSQEELLREQEQRRQYEQMMARPAAPVAPPVEMAAAPATTMTDVVAPTTGAVPPAAAPAAAPVAPTQLTPEDRQYESQGLQEGPIAREAALNMPNIIGVNKNDPDKLLQIAQDPSVPEAWRKFAAEQSSELRKRTRDEQVAAARANRLPDTTIQRLIKEDTEKGSHVKAYLLNRFGFKEAANNELAKLGYLDQWQSTTDAAGNQAYVQFRNGLPIRGLDMNGLSIEPERLSQFSAVGKTAALKPEISGTAYVKRDENGNVTARGVRTTQILPNGRTRTMIESGGRTFDINQGWEPESISTAAEKAVQQKQINLAFDPIIAAAKSGASFLGEFNAKHGTNFAIQGYDANRTPIVVDQNTNQLVTPTSTGVVTTTTTKPRAPGSTPADIESQREINKTTSTEFIKINAANAGDEAKKASQASGLLSSIDNIIRQTTENPQFFNAMQSPAYRAFAAAQGPEAAARLKELSDAVRINEKDRPRFNQLMNDIKRLELAGITSSGLTASQLNTERESQRVVNAFAVNTSDSPQAARIQAEIARAQVVYQREFARFLGRADPTMNPARIRMQFDEQIGDKIWSDLMPKLEAIQRGGVVDFRSNR